MNDSTAPARPRLLRVLFGFEAPVGPRIYAAAGFSLMAFKYLVEAAVVRLAIGRAWGPLEYFDPTLRSRYAIGIPFVLFDTVLQAPAPPWLQWGLIIWTLPFIWMGVSMSVRRAADAGLSPWLGLLFLAPWVNYVLMLVLAMAPSRASGWVEPVAAPARPAARPAAGQVIGAAVMGLVIGLVMIWMATKGIQSYGVYLFLLTPPVFGAVIGFLANRPVVQSLGATQGITLLAYAVLVALLVLLGIEGFACVLMALPVAIPLTILGASAGRAMAASSTSGRKQALMAVLALPLLAALDRTHPELPVHEVASSIEIDAPPDAVWGRLIAFGAIPDPPEWLFRLGIACPKGARIEGEGTGAVRYCEFSTGPFVEPITVWDPPRRLAFEVAAQPDPMVEWSPWDIHPAHLDGSLRSRHGEFRLVALPGGRTRLEGSTWYTIDMAPAPYWRLWTDTLIGSIHQRVLRHVKRLAESR